ncbi:lytic transglycosylase domain-containing protein [Membranicola marinus]|uniref:Lytic transglycosylase domain-containing protein n=1 Tax=Membranihabitans marinus TaxID=1227546 RepID=A0A953HL50_9BACT|nr:lytic transglycosylase domain-containing protein [Membranihabitans marinus]MBY5957924.1 lytic transglycosylase domain-containing protein [Membranihabitans marinus]
MNIFSRPVLYSLGVLTTLVLVYGYISPMDANKDTVQGESDDHIKIVTTNHALPQQIRAVYLYKDFTFAGEKVPLEIEDVRERLERELTVNSYYHSSTILNIKRSQRFFPVIDKILTQRNIPLDFKYVAVAESNLDNVGSPAGAKGFWQLMPAVARSYGLIINNEIDERYHLEKSTVAATKLIQNYKDKFGSWSNAAGAYNIGEGNFRRESRLQKESDYYHMNFGSETNRYLFRVLALKEILSTPDRFGFDITTSERYQPWTEKLKLVPVTKSIPSLADFAHQHNMSYRELKVYNPWLLTNRLTVGSGQSFEIAVLK